MNEYILETTFLILNIGAVTIKAILRSEASEVINFKEQTKAEVYIIMRCRIYLLSLHVVFTE